jgi:hypothetical protein
MTASWSAHELTAPVTVTVPGELSIEMFAALSLGLRSRAFLILW